MAALTLGFTGMDPTGLDEVGVRFDECSRPLRGEDYAVAPGMFLAGDAGRGASLVVWAIAEGRKVAEQIHATLSAPPLFGNAEKLES